MQGIGKTNSQPFNSPKLIRFTELTEDEFFCTEDEDGARASVTFENPPCGSGGMFVSSVRFVSEHKKNPAAGLSIHGVEKTDETGRL